MNLKDCFWKLKNVIQLEENFVPKNYQSIGGMWTVDTYEYEGLNLTIMDEGWTIRIAGNGIDLINKGNDYRLIKGDLETLKKIMSELNV